MSRILVTGGTGFIGRHLIRQLVSQGCEVIATSRAQVDRAATDPVQWTHLELGTPESFEARLLTDVDCVIHLAARVHVMRRMRHDATRFQACNVAATQVLANQAARYGVRRFIYVSSVKVNGERTTDRPFAIYDEPRPQDAYGRSKWQAEQVLMDVAKSTGLDVVIVRPPLVYGPGVGANFLSLLSLVYTGIPLPLGSVQNKRSMIGVWNLVDWIWRAMTDLRLSGRAWLVSDGEDISTPQLVELIAFGMQRRPRLWRAPVSVLRAAAFAMRRSAQLSRLLDSLQVDITATREATDWTPPVSIQNGIERTAAWYVGYGHAHR